MDRVGIELRNVGKKKHPIEEQTRKKTEEVIDVVRK